MHGLMWLGRDLRYAVRSLLRDRGSVALALLALSLGIGATTTVFSVVYSALIDTHPFPEPSRVVHFYVHAQDRPYPSAWYQAPEFTDYREQNQVFSHLLGGASMEVLYNIDNTTYRARGALLDTQALGALRLRTIAGRDAVEADGAPGAPPVFLMTDRLWNERFGRDPAVLGRTFRMNGTMRTLVGILPARFVLHNADVFFPTTMTADLQASLIGGPGGQPLSIWAYGRLKDGVTFEQAEAQLEVIARNVATKYPNPYRYTSDLTVTVISLADAYTAESMKEMIYILVGAVTLLLLIACSNVANLLLARATAREAELALRASVGASRGRLIQQVLAESFVLAAVGTALGAALAYVGVQWARVAIPVTALPAAIEIRFAGQVLLATIGVTMIVTFLCGVVPALRAARGDLRTRLMSSGKGAGLSAGRGRIRMILVTVQVALAVVLLVGAGLMMRTLVALQQIEIGLDTSGVLTGNFAFPQDDGRTPEDTSRFFQQVVHRVATLPGVVAVSPSLAVPMQGGPFMPIAVTGVPANDNSRAVVDFVGDGYFEAIGLPLVRGRLLSPVDVEASRPVVVVNRRFAEVLLGGADPIGRTVTLGGFGGGGDNPPPLFEIVGIVGDVRNSGLQDPVRPQVYLPYTQPGFRPNALVVRTSVDPLSLQRSVLEQVWAIDPGVALMNVMSLDEVLHRTALAGPRFGVGLMGTFGVVGLILAAIGVFSVMAYAVSLQTREIGIRMALGAEPRAVMQRTLVRGLVPIVIGLIVGVGAAYGLSRVLANQIFGVTATDPWTFAGVSVVLLVVGAAACVLPARRAMQVDPLAALRGD
jgi:putative ABC transport system permease protein